MWGFRGSNDNTVTTPALTNEAAAVLGSRCGLRFSLKRSRQSSKVLPIGRMWLCCWCVDCGAIFVFVVSCTPIKGWENSAEELARHRTSTAEQGGGLWEARSCYSL